MRTSIDKLRAKTVYLNRWCRERSIQLPTTALMMEHIIALQKELDRYAPPADTGLITDVVTGEYIELNTKR
jgi:hypothetical protein